jgi:hypothetical protein
MRSAWLADLLRAFGFKQRLQVLRRGFELFLRQAHDHRLGELDKAPALASIDGCEPGSAIDRTQRVFDFEVERAADRLGAEPLVGSVVGAFRDRFETASQELSDLQKGAAHAERSIARLSRLRHLRNPVGSLVGVYEKGKDLIHGPVNDSRDVELVHGHLYVSSLRSSAANVVRRPRERKAASMRARMVLVPLAMSGVHRASVPRIDLGRRGFVGLAQLHRDGGSPDLRFLLSGGCRASPAQNYLVG